MNVTVPPLDEVRRRLGTLAPESFEQLAVRLLGWHLRRQGVIHANPTPHGHPDGGADAHVVGTLGGVTGTWRVDAKAAGTGDKVRDEVRAVLGTHSEARFIFVCRHAFGLAKKLEGLREELRAADPAHRLHDGAEVLAWAHDYWHVATELHNDGARWPLRVPEAVAGPLPTEPVDALRVAADRLAGGGGLVVLTGVAGVIHPCLADELALALLQGRPGVVADETAPLREVLDARERLPPDVAVVAYRLERDIDAGALVSLARRGPVALLTTPDLAHPVTSMLADALVIELGKVNTGRLDHYEAEISRRTSPAREMNALAGECDGRPGLLRDWLLGSRGRSAATAALVDIDRDGWEGDALALALGWLTLDVSARAHVARLTGRAQAAIDRLLHTRDRFTWDRASDTMVAPDALAAALLPVLCHPSRRDSFDRGLAHDEGVPDTVIARLGAYGFCTGLLRERARVAAAADLRRCVGAGLLLAGLDDDADAILAARIAAIPQIPVAEARAVLQVVARLAWRRANATCLWPLMTKASPALPPRERAELAAQVLDPWSCADPAAVLRSVESSLDAELAAASARPWLLCTVSFRYSRGATLSLGEAAWNENSPRVREARDAAVRLLMSLLDHDDDATRARGWALAGELWTGRSLTADPGYVPSQVKVAAEQIAHRASATFATEGAWEEWGAVEACLRAITHRHSVAFCEVAAHAIERIPTDPRYQVWRTLIGSPHVVLDPPALAAALRASNGQDSPWMGAAIFSRFSGAPATIAARAAALRLDTTSFLDVLVRATGPEVPPDRDPRVLVEWLRLEPSLCDPLLTDDGWAQVPARARGMLALAISRSGRDPSALQRPEAKIEENRLFNALRPLSQLRGTPAERPGEEVYEYLPALWELLAPNQRVSFLYELAKHPDGGVRDRALMLLEDLRWATPPPRPSDIAAVILAALGDAAGASAAPRVAEWLFARDTGWLGETTPGLLLAVGRRLAEDGEHAWRCYPSQRGDVIQRLLHVQPAEWVRLLGVAATPSGARALEPTHGDQIGVDVALAVLAALEDHFPSSLAEAPWCWIAAKVLASLPHQQWRSARTAHEDDPLWLPVLDAAEPLRDNGTS